jgi:hypothetical protein
LADAPQIVRVEEKDRRTQKERTMSFFGDISRATRNSMNRVVEARQRQAQRYVNGVLLAMDDEALIRAGYDRKVLERQESSLYPF